MEPVVVIAVSRPLREIGTVTSKFSVPTSLLAEEDSPLVKACRTLFGPDTTVIGMMCMVDQHWQELRDTPRLYLADDFSYTIAAMKDALDFMLTGGDITETGRLLDHIETNGDIEPKGQHMLEAAASLSGQLTPEQNAAIRSLPPFPHLLPHVTYTYCTTLGCDCQDVPALVPRGIP